MIEYFVSSTFRDMQAERDILQNVVLKELQKYANARGEYISMLDLRWGINSNDMDSDESMAKVLSVCLQDIDRCKPHMIILLGDRYGSIPSRQTINRFIENDSSGVYSTEEIMDKSVTEIEIIHGILSGRNISDDVTICIREPLVYEKLPKSIRDVYDSSTDDECQRIKELKSTLIERFPDNIIYYSAEWDEEKQCLVGLDSFAEQLTNRLKMKIDAYLPAQLLCEEEKHLNLQKTYYSQICKHFFGRQKELDAFRDFLENSEQNLQIIRGSHGIGKSSFCAKISEMFQHECYVIPVLTNLYNQQTDSLQILKQIVWNSEKLLGVEKHFNETVCLYDEWKNQAKNVIQELSKKKKVLLIIDGVDMLHPDEHKKSLDFLPFYDLENVKTVITMQENYNLPISINVNFNISYLTLCGMEDEDIKHLVSIRLSKMHKELPDYVIDSIIYAARGRSPYYLDLLFLRINHLSEKDFSIIDSKTVVNGNGNENLYQYINNLVLKMPSEEYDAVICCLINVADVLSNELIALILKLLLYTNGGLRIEDFFKLFKGKISVADLSKFAQMAEPILQRDNYGRIYYSNAIAVKGAVKYLEHINMNEAGIERALHRYLINVPDSDTVKRNEFLPICLRCNRPKDAVSYLSSAYLKEYNKILQDGSVPVLYDDIVGSLRLAFSSSLYERYNIFDFIMNMIGEARSVSAEECHGFVSAILFTYDLLFENTFNIKQKQTIMSSLHELATEVLYPNRAKNILYLRTIYVCCEQCGIRSSDFQYRRRMYKEFLEYCSEMVECMPEDFELRNYIFHDLSIAYEKNAEEYYRSNSNYSMEMYDKAVNISQKISSLAPFYETLKDRTSEIRLSRASSIIGREMLFKYNNLSAWDAERFRSALKDLKYIEEYFTENYHRFGNRKRLMVTYYQLANYYYCLDDCEKEYGYLLSMNDLAKKICSESSSEYYLDYTRQSLKRLGICKYESPSEEMRLKWLKEAVDYAKTILSVTASETSHKILFYDVEEWLFRVHDNVVKKDSAITDKINRDIDAEEDIYNTASIFKQILECLTPDTIKDVYSAPADYEDVEKIYKCFMQILPMAQKYQNYLSVIAAQAFNRRELSKAIRFGELCLNICNLFDGYSNKEIMLSNRIINCHLLYTCYNYLMNEFFGSNEKFDEASDMKQYYLQQMYNNCKILEVLYPENKELPEYKEKLIFLYSDPDSFCHVISWINLLCYAIEFDSKNNCSVFWNEVERNKFYVSGQKYHQTHLTITENSHFTVSDQNRPLHQEQLLTAGKYLCEHISEEKVQKLLYLSDLFEVIALEYAYQHGMLETAKTIVENGYDNFLELPLLYVLRKYDRHEYEKRVKELKVVCHCHNIDIIKKRSYGSKSKTKWDVFCNEYLAVAKKLIAESKLWDKDDPRLRNCRLNIKYDYC